MFKPVRKTGPAVPLTEARARLFPLVDDLLAGRTDRVALVKRGVQEHVLLVRARDVARMEAELSELRKRVVSEPRPLWGTATVVGDVEEMIAESRREANELYEAKWAAFFAKSQSPALVDDASSNTPVAVQSPHAEPPTQE